MDKLRSHFPKIRVPEPQHKVYKDECMFSFDTPESETGLYVCLNFFLGWGKEHVKRYSEQTGNCVFLHLKRTKREIHIEKETEPEKKIARLAIGVEGGFNPDARKKKYEYEDHNSIVVLPDFDVIPLPNSDLPELVLQSISGILKAESPNRLAELEAEAKAWDGEIRQVSKHAENLKQLDNGVKVPPSGWKCEVCDKTDNLWLNLTDGKILCGRKQMDGSGGNNHAVDHYSNVGHPLAVKLGTITPDGKADVYSYDEDDMVLDPDLSKHLAHFGINMMNMEKTEKTMLELEIDYNQRAWEWSRMTEAGASLQPVFGPGYTGLKNLGNSCYLNSVMQVLMTIPPFSDRYYKEAPTILANCSIENSQKDFNVQMAKLSKGLLSGRYSMKAANANEKDIDECQQGISASSFRLLVGEGHPEFSSKRQQDAMEFLDHILKLVTRNSANKPDPGHCFRFEVEDKFICSESKKVRYVTRNDLYLPFPVPMESSSNKAEVEAFLARKAEAEANKTPFNEEQVHHKVPFEACLSKLASPEEITAHSSAVDRDVTMEKITRLQTFPDFLVIQLVKFGIGSNWQPIKYDVSIDMPQELDLSVLKGSGLQPGEELLPEKPSQPATSNKEPEADMAVVQQLTEMGFPFEACKKAVQLTGNCGSEAAMNWVMEHMGDPDFADPLPSPQSSSNKPKVQVSEEGIAMITSMGFSRAHATLALEETQNNVERAADWIFSHEHMLDVMLSSRSDNPTPQEGAASTSTKVPCSDGAPKYELAAFISHMGTSIHVGHYVCHIKKDGEWIIFNDNKVCKSMNPPIEMGYIYLYKRKTSS